MAKVTSPHQLSGTIYDTTFFNIDGETYARRPTSLRGDKWWDRKNLLRAQQRAIEFGGASQAARAILQQLPTHMRHCGDRYTHNHLLNAIRKNCTIHRKYDKDYPGEKTFALTTLSTQGIIAALHKRQFGKSTDIRPTITHHANTNTINISGLLKTETPSPEGSAAVPSSKKHSPVEGRAGSLYIRIHIAQVQLAQMHRPQHASRKRAEFQFQDGSSSQPLAPNITTGWFPITALENGTIDLPLPPTHADTHTDTHTAIFVAIEWRRYTGLRYKNLHERSTLTAIYARPDRTQHVPGTKADRTQASPFRFLRDHYRKRIQARAKAHLEARYRARTHPKAQLSKAIAHLTHTTT